LNKTIAKILHLGTETYNKEQVSKIFRQNFSWNMHPTFAFGG